MAEPLDLNQSLPDLAHESIRVAVLAAIDDIAWNTASTDISFDLVDTLFQLLSTMQDAVAALNDRLAAVEPPPTPTPEP